MHCKKKFLDLPIYANLVCEITQDVKNVKHQNPYHLYKIFYKAIQTGIS